MRKMATDLPFTDRETAITVVDDEPYSRDVLVRAATSWQFACQTADCAEHALDILNQHPTPIVVTDLRMPGRGGEWLVKEIHRRWHETSIIVITGHQDSDTMLRCMEAGAQHFFLKPVNFDEFRHALEVTLRMSQLRLTEKQIRIQLERKVERQTRKIRRTFLSAIDSLVRTLEARDPYTSGHSMRVREYVLRLADHIRLDPRLRKQLSLAAKLHDIGKIGLAEGILNKPNPLTEEEVGVVRTHPVVGERILRPIVRSEQVLKAIRGHHEHFNGAGYPDGLRGENIPLLARLLTIADCFDALTSTRAYRKAWSHEQAIAYLQQRAGTQFDPFFVEPFVRIIT